MIVGTLLVRGVIRSSHSLKEKRRVVKGLKERLQHRFNLSVAEVDEQDSWQQAVLGMAAVGNDAPFVRSLLDQAAQYARGAVEFEVVDVYMETFGVGEE
ncbi:MAG: DUF503 domain-containing protein [Planctomycetes bacterium]|nr:DUF503 domain-containing protein [Planctomycetota bacterium]